MCLFSIFSNSFLFTFSFSSMTLVSACCYISLSISCYLLAYLSFLSLFIFFTKSIAYLFISTFSDIFTSFSIRLFFMLLFSYSGSFSCNCLISTSNCYNCFSRDSFKIYASRSFLFDCISLRFILCTLNFFFPIYLGVSLAWAVKY